MAVAGAGLEGVVATESSICFIDGDAGVLSYAGYDIHALAAQAAFEEVVYLLWYGRLPVRAELDQLRGDLEKNRALPEPVIQFLASAPSAPPMDILRTAVSLLGLHDPQARDTSPESNMRKAVQLVARTATVVSTYDRLRTGKAIVESDPSLGFAANFLYTLNGKRPDPVMERAMDVALILHADHELNASTFAARVVAATLSDMYSAVTAAIGALKGPLHGGANEDVIRLLLEAKTPERGVRLVREKLERREKIPGFGHRVYRTEDPRATHLRALSEELGRRTNHLDLYQISRDVEQAVRDSKGLKPNVDFYSASAYYSLGIPIDLFTPVFAVSRMSGWTAHVLEQLRDNRLIRPRADYSGPPPGLPWTPIADRS